MPITLPVQLGEPRTEQGITLVPLFPRTQPRAHYLTLDVAATAAEAGVASRTGAHADTFAARRTTIDEIATAFPLQPGQCGAIVLLPSSACLDYVSRPDAWAGLYP